jgi:2-keto-4-pentenoate hydratase
MLSVDVRDVLAADLAEAERSRVPIAPLTTANPDIDVVDAYEIQLINIRQRVAEGATVIGHKVGLSSKAMQEMMGVDEPDYGHLLDEMAVFEDRPVPAGRYL